MTRASATVMCPHATPGAHPATLTKPAVLSSRAHGLRVLHHQQLPGDPRFPSFAASL